MRKTLVLLILALVLAVPSAHAVFTPIPPDQLDFYEHYDTLYQSVQDLPCAFLPCNMENPDTPLMLSLKPETADVNGTFDEANKLPTPNGMLDCLYEMAMISAILGKPAGFALVGPYGQGANRDQLTADWEFNLARLRSDLGYAATLLETAGGSQTSPLYAILTGLIMIGDEESCSFVQHIFLRSHDIGAVGTFDPANYRRHTDLFGPAGDADRDGYSNYAEYVAFGPSSTKGPAEFLEASLNPAIKPAGEPDMADSDRDGLLDSQEDLNGNGVVDEGETDPQEADTDGDGVSDGMERIVWGTDPSTADDKPEVPALGLLGLAALGGLIGAYGAKRMR